MRSGIAWVALAVALCGANCEGAGGATGKSNHYDFEIDGPGGDQQGATPLLLDHGMGVTITTSARASGCGDAPPLYSGVASSDPSVASFALLSDGSIAATTLAAGSADLELVDDQGHVVDSLTIDVEAISSLEIATNDVPVQVIAAGSGQTYTMDVTAFDTAGRELATGSAHIEVGTTGALAATAANPQVLVQSLAPGVATVTASIDGVPATVEVDSFELADVTAIELGSGDNAPLYSQSEDEWLVWLRPMTATGPVLGAACTWQLSDPEAQLVHDSAAAYASDPLGEPYYSAEFTITGTGPVSFTATCTIGSAQATMTLQR